MMHFGTLAVILFCGITHTSGAVVAANNTESQLLHYLFHNYSAEIRPVINNWEWVTVKLGLMLKQIIVVDEKNQLLTTNVWLRKYWTDNFLVWDPAKFGGLKSINVDPNRVWTPDIVLYNAGGMDQEVGSLYRMIDTKVILSHTGQITWLSPAILKTECKIDVRNFPFDTQSCPLQFGSWTYNRLKIDIQLHQTTGIDLDKYSANMEWNLVEAPGIREVTIYSCCPEPYPNLTFTIKIRRRAMFYLYNLVIPCFVIALLSLCSFYLPADSGERVGFVITVLLAMSVFMLMVTENMPQSAEIPLASEFFMAAMLQIALSLVTTCIVIRYSKNKAPIRPAVHRLVNNWMAKLVFLKSWRTKNSSVHPVFTNGKPAPVIANLDDKSNKAECNTDELFPIAEQLKETCEDMNKGNSVKSSEIEKLIREVKVLSDKVREGAEQEKNKDEWMFAASVLDRFFLITFSLTLLLICVGIVTQIPPNTTVY